MSTNLLGYRREPTTPCGPSTRSMPLRAARRCRSARCLRLAALEAECAGLVALGAVRVRLLPADGDNESCLVMQDIEGSEFCLG